MKITGKLLGINPIQTFDSGFSKREFLVEYAENPEYPQKIKFEIFKDKCSILDNPKFQQGVGVVVDYNLRGNEWDSPNGKKYFVQLECWKIDVLQAPQQQYQAPQQQQQYQAPPQVQDQYPGGDGSEF
jgi:hypothetical protein